MEKIEYKYFKYRRVSESTYESFDIPFWIESRLPNKKNKILDYGCGFGQVMTSLNKAGYSNIYGVDIEDDALEYCAKIKLNVKKLDLLDLENPFDFKFGSYVSKSIATVSISVKSKSVSCGTAHIICNPFQ